MFRLLRILLSPRSTSKKASIPNRDEHVQGEERIAISTRFTFDAAEFSNRTGYHIRHEKHFIQAVIHRSFLQLCPPGYTQSNERMEFLGDSILNFVVAEHLYNVFPDDEEGSLSKLRSRLVSRQALGECARQLKLADFLLMSPSAHQSIQAGSDSILADAFEAFISAIYLDGGFKAARTFIEDNLLSRFSTAQITRDENFKSRLLEYAQSKALGTPKYVTVDESGPDHSPIFTVEVLVNGIPVGSGQGGNKKAAEQIAAARALDHFRKSDPTGLT